MIPIFVIVAIDIFLRNRIQPSHMLRRVANVFNEGNLSTWDLCTRSGSIVRCLLGYAFSQQRILTWIVILEVGVATSSNGKEKRGAKSSNRITEIPKPAGAGRGGTSAEAEIDLRASTRPYGKGEFDAPNTDPEIALG